MDERTNLVIDLNRPTTEPVVIDLSQLRGNSDSAWEATEVEPTVTEDAWERAAREQRADVAPRASHTVPWQPPAAEYPLDADESPWRDWIRPLLSAACLLFAAFCLLKAIPGSPLNATSSANESLASVVTQPEIRTRKIEEFDVGMRALGRNPIRGEVETAPEPDAERLRKLVLQMTKVSGRNLSVKLLRPLAWIEANGVVEGGTFFLDLPEMGAVGDAHVEAILPCPPIAPGSGNVVTGVFAHEAETGQPILSVTFANGAYIPGVTDNHPVYSVDRNAFLPIGEMREGETVQVEGGTTQITRIATRPARPGEMLYNLETYNEHVYQVTTAGVLVHNSCILDIRFRGARGIDSLRTATHHDISNAFSQSGFKPSSHFIARVKDIRTEQLGLNTFDDLEGMFRNGNIVDANDGLKALVHGDMAIIFNPNTNVLVTLTPW